MLYICNTDSFVFYHYIQNVVLQDTAAQGDIAQFFRIGMYNAVGHGFADRGLDVVDLLQGGVQLGGKAGRRRPGKALVGGAAEEAHHRLVARFHYVKPPVTQIS